MTDANRRDRIDALCKAAAVFENARWRRENADFADVVTRADTLVFKDLTDAEDAVRSAIGWAGYAIQRAEGEGADAPPILPWFDLLHSDGYRREAALRALHTEPPAPLFLFALVSRLNDWAPQVREVAWAAVMRQANQGQAGELALILWRRAHAMAAWQRAGSAGLSTLLSAPVFQGPVMDRLRRATEGPAVQMLRSAVRRDWVDPYLVSLSQGAVHPGLRAECAWVVASGQAGWVAGRRRQWVDKTQNVYAWRTDLTTRPLRIDVDAARDLVPLAQDPSARVRRALLDGLIVSRRSGALDIAQRLQDDLWPSVRERAAYLLANPARPASPD